MHFLRSNYYRSWAYSVEHYLQFYTTRKMGVFLVSKNLPEVLRKGTSTNALYISH